MISPESALLRKFGLHDLHRVEDLAIFIFFYGVYYILVLYS